ncbi:sulfite exporter TauE/SafE family protein [Sphingorhabdus sp.]|uniref:sulfite exporter TauE/SafE family protein n=1 Tax=Sphingorhabdus sp. TaxID=1902408 RepID=UPI0032B7C65B
MSAILALLFGLIALIYASVGFGGGSTFTALLTLTGIEPRLIPVISLCCNIVVVTGGTIHFWRAGLIDWKTVLPLLVVSAPLAFLGGLTPLKETTFLLILGSSLLLSAVALIVPQEKLPRVKLPKPVIFGLSGAVGLLAGLSGIGGGIFMAPVLHLIRWADAKRVAAFASLYILVNSMAGLAGQLLKGGMDAVTQPAAVFWPLLLAVLIGGQIGSQIGIKLLSPIWLRRITALLVGYAAIRLLLQVY